MSEEITNLKLFQSIQALCDQAIDKVQIFKKQGGLNVINYQNLPVKNIDYSMGAYHFDWKKIEYFEYFEWNSRSFSSFLETELCSLLEFEEAANQIKEEFKVTESIKGIGLVSLLQLIMKKCPNGQIDRRNIDNYIKLLISEYESYRNNTPIIWNISLWLKNIYIESEEIEIAPNVFLKRPTKDQLAEIKPKPNNISEFERITGRELSTGAILSFEVPVGPDQSKGLYPKKITTEIEMWLNIFRLLKPTDVTIGYQSIIPVSIFEHAVSENKIKTQDSQWLGKIDHIDTSSYKLYLEKDEEELLKDFAKKVNSPIYELSNTSYLTGNPYDLAFHRYIDSLLKTEINAYKILSSITSLEALLSDGSSEITFKIRLRVSKLLSHFGFDPLDVSKKIRDAYNLRSKLVHGAKTESKNKDLLEFARQSTHEVLNFNRICLLVALQLKHKMDKQKLIMHIDNSFIDDSSNENLRNLINESVEIPIVNPFRKVE